MIFALCLCLSLGVVGPAGAVTVQVADPTPTGTFTGSYTYDEEVACDADGDGQANETCTETRTAEQQGYVQVSNDGGAEVQACNANPEHSETSGQDLTGYAYLSPTGSGPTSPTYGNNFAGADDYDQAEDAGNHGDPCPGA
jgi:hypothetical protein